MQLCVQKVRSYIYCFDCNALFHRYALFAWCHVWSLFFTMPAFLLNKATMSGLIWYVMPMSLITINDIGAYMVGFFGGKTPLIKLSPKKTREGFIGGGIITVILGTILTHYLIQVTRSYIRLII